MQPARQAVPNNMCGVSVYDHIINCYLIRAARPRLASESVCVVYVRVVFFVCVPQAIMLEKLPLCGVSATYNGGGLVRIECLSVRASFFFQVSKTTVINCECFVFGLQSSQCAIDNFNRITFRRSILQFIR